jgi:hypothetical protein
VGNANRGDCRHAVVCNSAHRSLRRRAFHLWSTGPSRWCSADCVLCWVHSRRCARRAASSYRAMGWGSGTPWSNRNYFAVCVCWNIHVWSGVEYRRYRECCHPLDTDRTGIGPRAATEDPIDGMNQRKGCSAKNKSGRAQDAPLITGGTAKEQNPAEMCRQDSNHRWQ